jgi:hypothetical protein
MSHSAPAVDVRLADDLARTIESGEPVGRPG